MTFEGFKKELNEKLRTRMLLADIVAACLILVAQICIALFIFAANSDLNRHRYILIRIIIPSGLNFLTFLISICIVKFGHGSDFVKNLASILSVYELCSVVAIFHNYYTLVMVSMAVPVFMSAVYGDKRILRIINTLTLPIICVSFYTNYHEYLINTNSLYWLTSMMCLLVFLILAFVCAEVILIIQKKQMDYMMHSNQNEKDLIERLKLDPLTELNNRNSLKENLPKYIEQFVGGRSSAFVVMIDIDHFKQVNDTFGHLQGDNVLKRLAQIIRKNLSSRDMAFRFGGEEFLLLLARKPEATCEDIKDFVSWIKEEFCRAEYGFCSDMITFSAGIAMCKHNLTGEEWIRRADDAMYLSKVKGRNTITISDTE